MNKDGRLLQTRFMVSPAFVKETNEMFDDLIKQLNKAPLKR